MQAGEGRPSESETSAGVSERATQGPKGHTATSKGPLPALQKNLARVFYLRRRQDSASASTGPSPGTPPLSTTATTAAATGRESPAGTQLAATPGAGPSPPAVDSKPGVVRELEVSPKHGNHSAGTRIEWSLGAAPAKRLKQTRAFVWGGH